MDLLGPFRVTRLANGNMADCLRFRVECRGVDSDDQSVELFDYMDGGSGPGSISFAFKTNVNVGDDDAKRRLVRGVAQLLIEARQANGDEP